VLTLAALYPMQNIATAVLIVAALKNMWYHVWKAFQITSAGWLGRELPDLLSCIFT
jgi:hypothetical protein